MNARLCRHRSARRMVVNAFSASHPGPAKTRRASTKRSQRTAHSVALMASAPRSRRSARQTRAPRRRPQAAMATCSCKRSSLARALRDRPASTPLPVGTAATTSASMASVAHATARSSVVIALPTIVVTTRSLSRSRHSGSASQTPSSARTPKPEPIVRNAGNDARLARASTCAMASSARRRQQAHATARPRFATPPWVPAALETAPTSALTKTAARAVKRASTGCALPLARTMAV